nr:hypothetical protein [Citrobacter freundii]
YGFLSLTRNVDGNDEKEKDHDWAMSYRLGLLMELTDQTTPQSNIGAAVSYLHMQSSHVQSPSIYQGSYDNPYLWFASVNYSYQF